jgi:hypothetical protein
MESLERHNEPKKGINKIFIFALLAAVLLVAAGIGLWSLKPSIAGMEEEALEGVHREGSPEFEEVTKRILVKPDMNRTTESPTALGTIMMSIPAVIHNRSDKVLTTLEVNVGVIDQKGKVLKEKTYLVVPREQPYLGPNQAVSTTAVVEGFGRDDDRANVKWKVTAVKTE